MVPLPQSARAVIESGRVAHLVTLGRDGTPHVTCVWVGTDGDDIVWGTIGAHQKLRNLARDPRVVLSMETDRLNDFGLLEYLVVNGRATIEEGGGSALLQRLAHVYLGPDVKFPPMDDPPAGFVIRITPERLGGVGPWMA